MTISLYSKDASKASTLASEQQMYASCAARVDTSCAASSGNSRVNCFFYNTRNRLSKRSQREDELLVCWRILCVPEGNKPSEEKGLSFSACHFFCFASSTLRALFPVVDPRRGLLEFYCDSSKGAGRRQKAGEAEEEAESEILMLSELAESAR